MMQRSFINIAAVSILFFSLVFIVSSCRERNKELSLHQMKELMWDLTKVEAFEAYYLNTNSKIDARKAGDSNYAKVFMVHNVRSEDFFFTLDKYRSNPKNLQILLDSTTAYGSRIREHAFSDTVPLGNPTKR